VYVVSSSEQGDLVHSHEGRYKSRWKNGDGPLEGLIKSHRKQNESLHAPRLFAPE